MKVDLSAEIFDRDGGRIYVPNTEPIPPADRHKVTPERYDKEPVQITAAKAICFALDQNPNRDKPLGLREMYDRVELADRIYRSPDGVEMTTRESETCQAAMIAIGYTPYVVARITEIFDAAIAAEKDKKVRSIAN